MLTRLLEPLLSGDDLRYGEPRTPESSSLLPEDGKQLSWKTWLGDPELYGYRVMIELSPESVVKLSENALTDSILKTFLRLFPLLLIAQNEEPIEPLSRFLGTEQPEVEEQNPLYTIEQFAADTFFSQNEIERWVRAAVRKKQAIFYGPPGTGKTFIAQRLAKYLISRGDGFTETLQFHPSYAYEDFMQGLRPKALKDGGVEYALLPGRFKDFCTRAQECKDKCVLVIDEINRANLSRVFAELMYLLEYRDESVPLAGGGRLQIPSNVFLIGTMNTADRSIALVDHALRRRFAFLALYPNYEVLEKFHINTGFEPSGLIKVLQRLNAAINDKHYSVGMSFFLDPDIKTSVQDVWQMEIEPYVEELFFDQPDKAASFTWDRVRQDIERT
jgi:5-methylcytosine-specific restriction protein B